MAAAQDVMNPRQTPQTDRYFCILYHYHKKKRMRKKLNKHLIALGLGSKTGGD